MSNSDPVAATATIREVYALVAQSKAELSQEIASIKNALLEELKQHELTHIREDAARKSRTRFAMTTAIAFGTLLGGFAQWLLTQLLQSR